MAWGWGHILTLSLYFSSHRPLWLVSPALTLDQQIFHVLGCLEFQQGTSKTCHWGLISAAGSRMRPSHLQPETAGIRERREGKAPSTLPPPPRPALGSCTQEVSGGDFLPSPVGSPGWFPSAPGRAARQALQSPLPFPEGSPTPIPSPLVSSCSQPSPIPITRSTQCRGARPAHMLT